MTEPLFRADAYLGETACRILAVTPEGGIVPDRTVFYPQGGGQPGDSGLLRLDGRVLRIANAVKGEGEAIVLAPEPGQGPVRAGEEAVQALDWDRRWRHMRVHTALHLLSVVVPLPVTGGAIGAERGRLDFDMPEPPGDPAALEAALNALAGADHPVGQTWITDDELAANPGLVKTMAVKPPVGQGRVRLVRIGATEPWIDLQPCGGTHVRRTGEIGPLRLGRIEKKGRQNRRIAVELS